MDKTSLTDGTIEILDHEDEEEEDNDVELYPAFLELVPEGSIDPLPEMPFKSVGG